MEEGGLTQFFSSEKREQGLFSKPFLAEEKGAMSIFNHQKFQKPGQGTP